jgi:hypothetical protein
LEGAAKNDGQNVALLVDWQLHERCDETMNDRAQAMKAISAHQAV